MRTVTTTDGKKVKVDYYRAAKCPECGQTMDKVIGWVCKKCGKLKLTK